MRTAIVLTALLALALSACGKSTDAWAAGFNNKVCPVQGGEVQTDPPLAVDYEGKKIGFCCPGCPQDFLKDPQKYMQKMRAEPSKYGFRE